MRTPADHYEAADQILTNVEREDGTATWVKGELARAQVHALLAQVYLPEVMEAPPTPIERI